MQFISLLVTIVIAAFVSAAPMSCRTIPDHPDMNVAKQVYAVAETRHLDERELLATFETAYVESHVNNLNCGDADSLGVFQQRPSQGWGTPKQIMDVAHATNSYINVLIPNAKKYPKYTAGQLAQSVQGSQFPTRYDQAEKIAKDIIKKVRGH
ncbi:hypothetical protein BOTBODRAFT_149298 [Botryobasidium botryosum FD-172 SS1]|uniref:Uncharacterized protein n=1 Tax=Botryobasidium botryosum (strain FD-172 SS1) TaxID=930990 RepID=A0A067M6Q1_BOTB1|nr:hypothetical protein BOTBODRAFT_149298 [Botryobasidium botryosum FD-172 SS1]